MYSSVKIKKVCIGGQISAVAIWGQGRGQISKAAKIKVTTVFWDIGNNIHYVSQEYAM